MKQMTLVCLHNIDLTDIERKRGSKHKRGECNHGDILAVIKKNGSNRDLYLFLKKGDYDRMLHDNLTILFPYITMTLKL